MPLTTIEINQAKTDGKPFKLPDGNGLYLRGQDGREGILLVVHQKPRPKGWKQPGGTYLNFEAVVQRLRTLAARIRSESPAGPQPEICIIDVSSCARPIARRRSAREPSTGTKQKTST
jgi:hypothetical protein